MGIARTSVCTIIDLNYLPQALALGTSLKASGNNGRSFYVLVIGTNFPINVKIPGFNFLTVPEIDLAKTEWDTLRATYDVVELATALKPRLLKFLLNIGYEVVTFLDPDVLVMGALNTAEDLALKHSIVLTPHRLTPCRVINIPTMERRFLKYGTFNLGFISVTKKASDFLEWWSDRTTWFATRTTFGDYFTDQKWINLVPSLFEYTILKDASYNVAPWNLDERNLSLYDGNYFVSGKPLVFFHFSQLSSLIFQKKSREAIMNAHRDFNFSEFDLSMLKHLASLYEVQLQSTGSQRENIERAISDRHLQYRFSSFIRVTRLNQAYRQQLLTDRIFKKSPLGELSLLVKILDRLLIQVTRSRTLERLIQGLIEDWHRFQKKIHPWY